MPILEYRLTAGRHSDDQIGELLLASANLYAEVLKSPVDRVRVTATLHQPQHAVVAGRLVSDGAPSAPFFHFLVLEGRPVEECQALITGFTDLVVSRPSAWTAAWCAAAAGRSRRSTGASPARRPA